MKNKYYKWTINCDITVIAKNKKESIEIIMKQLSKEDSDVEVYSKYTKFGKAKRVRFYEG